MSDLSHGKPNSQETVDGITYYYDANGNVSEIKAGTTAGNEHTSHSAPSHNTPRSSGSSTSSSTGSGTSSSTGSGTSSSGRGTPDSTNPGSADYSRPVPHFSSSASSSGSTTIGNSGNTGFGAQGTHPISQESLVSPELIRLINNASINEKMAMAERLINAMPRSHQEEYRRQLRSKYEAEYKKTELEVKTAIIKRMQEFVDKYKDVMNPKELELQNEINTNSSAERLKQIADYFEKYKENFKKKLEKKEAVRDFVNKNPEYFQGEFGKNVQAWLKATDSQTIQNLENMVNKIKSDKIAADAKAEENARIKAEEDARIKAEEDARIKAEEDARIKAEEDARIKAEADSQPLSPEIIASRNADAEAIKSAMLDKAAAASKKEKLKNLEAIKAPLEDTRNMFYKAFDESRDLTEEEAQKLGDYFENMSPEQQELFSKNITPYLSPDTIPNERKALRDTLSRMENEAAFHADPPDNSVKIGLNPKRFDKLSINAARTIENYSKKDKDITTEQLNSLNYDVIMQLDSFLKDPNNVEMLRSLGVDDASLRKGVDSIISAKKASTDALSRPMTEHIPQEINIPLQLLVPVGKGTTLEGSFDLGFKDGSPRLGGKEGFFKIGVSHKFGGPSHKKQAETPIRGIKLNPDDAHWFLKGSQSLYDHYIKSLPHTDLPLSLFQSGINQGDNSHKDIKLNPDDAHWFLKGLGLDTSINAPSSSHSITINRPTSSPTSSPTVSPTVSPTGFSEKNTKDDRYPNYFGSTGNALVSNTLRQYEEKKASEKAKKEAHKSGDTNIYREQLLRDALNAYNYHKEKSESVFDGWQNRKGWNFNPYRAMLLNQYRKI
jgi:hypothetical protein